jgi:hypothetical protein
MEKTVIVLKEGGGGVGKLRIIHVIWNCFLQSTIDEGKAMKY